MSQFLFIKPINSCIKQVIVFSLENIENVYANTRLTAYVKILDGQIAKLQPAKEYATQQTIPPTKLFVS